jgi:Tetracyclin repressor-like, C-terminal domain
LTEFTLRVVDGLGLDIDTMMWMGLTLSTFVRGFALAEIAELEAQRRTGMTEGQWRLSMAPYVRQIIASGRYPMLSRFIVEGEDLDPRVAFERGLDRVLDGMALSLGLDASHRPSRGAGGRQAGSPTASTRLQPPSST